MSVDIKMLRELFSEPLQEHEIADWAYSPDWNAGYKAAVNEIRPQMLVLLDQLEAAERREKELAAQLTRWSEWLARDPEDDIGDWMDEGWEIHASTPEASFARLIAEKQAEAFEIAERHARCAQDSAMLRLNAADLRRHAGGDV